MEEQKGANQSQQGNPAEKITLNIVTFIHIGYLCPLYGMAAHCNCSQLHCQEEWTVLRFVGVSTSVGSGERIG